MYNSAEVLTTESESSPSPQNPECCAELCVPGSEAVDQPEQTVEISVAISENAMEAYLTLYADPCDPYPFTLESIGDALAQREVTEGIQLEEVERILNNRELVSNFLIAKGVEVEHGQDAYIEYFFDPNPVPFVPKPDAVVDWREVNLVQQVEVNQLVARKISATPGVPGITVSQKKIEPRRGHDIRLPSGQGTKPNEEDPNELLAATSGAIRIENSRVVVEPLLKIPGDIDFSVGNIKFNGSVRIGGNVLPGFTVQAKGDIRIEGFVEGARIESGESVWVSQGVLGKSDDTVIRADKDVTVKFARQSLICAGGNINVQLEAVLSRLQSGGTVTVGSQTKKIGRILNSQVEAVEAVLAIDVGSPNESPTVISILPIPNSVIEKQALEIKERIDALQTNHNAILTEAAKLLQRKTTERSNWTKAHAEILGKMTEIGRQIEEELSSLDAQLAKLIIKAPPALIAQGIIYPGVQLTIGVANRTFSKRFEKVKAVLTSDNSSIVTVPI